MYQYRKSFYYEKNALEWVAEQIAQCLSNLQPETTLRRNAAKV